MSTSAMTPTTWNTPTTDQGITVSTNAHELPLEPTEVLPAPTPVHDEDESPEPTTAQETEARGELVQGELAGKPIWVPPVKQWRAMALHALRSGDMQTWAERTLLDDDLDIWNEVDPTIEEIEAFFAVINPLLGTDSGNSRASRRRSSGTRTR